MNDHEKRIVAIKARLKSFTTNESCCKGVRRVPDDVARKFAFRAVRDIEYLLSLLEGTVKRV